MLHIILLDMKFSYNSDTFSEVSQEEILKFQIYTCKKRTYKTINVF